MPLYKKLLRFLWVGFRLVDDDCVYPVPAFLKDSSQQRRRSHAQITRRQELEFDSHLGFMSMLGVLGLVVSVALVSPDYFHGCWYSETRSQEAARHAVAKAALLWLVSHMFVRLCLEQKNADKHVPRSFRSMMILENSAMLLFLSGSIMARVVCKFFFVPDQDKFSAWLFVGVTTRYWALFNYLLITGPVIAFSVAPRRHKLAEFGFDAWFLCCTMRTLYDVIQDAHCGAEYLWKLESSLGAGFAIVVRALQHFKNTHQLCMELVVFFRFHISEYEHLLPDITMILEIFSPLKKRYKRLLRVLAAGVLATLLPLYLRRADELLNKRFDTGLAHHPMDSTSGYVQMAWHFLLDSLLIWHAGRCYCTHRLKRRPANWESQIIAITSMMGNCVFLSKAAFYFGEPLDRLSVVPRVVFALNWLAFLLIALMSADTLCGRLPLEKTLKFCQIPLLYSFATMCDWVCFENLHELHEAQVRYGGGHHSVDNASVHAGGNYSGGNHSVFHSMRQAGHWIEVVPARVGLDLHAAGDGHGEDPSKSSELMMSFGVFAAVEAALIQTIGWMLHILEGLVEHDSHDEAHGHAEHGRQAHGATTLLPHGPSLESQHSAQFGEAVGALSRSGKLNKWQKARKRVQVQQEVNDRCRLELEERSPLAIEMTATSRARSAPISMPSLSQEM